MVRAPINGATLTWARSVMHLDPQEVARAAGIPRERVLAFESEEENPTLKQLEKIAKRLDRTTAFFFTDPPESPDVPEAPDFRGRGAGPLPPLLVREMRRAEQHRDALLDLQGPPGRTARIEPITWETHPRRASELRMQLGVREEFMSTEIDRSRVLDFWRGRLEQHGYLVFQTTKISLKDFRGLSIHHDSLPVVVLNGSDSNSGKVFTLFHEVAHLANRTSGLCSLVDGVDEEAVANAFAACFLMPEEQVTALLHVIDGTPEELAAEVAERFKVSRLAAGVRLRTLGVIDEDGLAAVRVQSDSIWEKHRKEQKKKGGGPPFWRVRYRDLGSAYIGAVARAVEDARVDWMDASYLLDARIPTVRQMFDEYYRLEGGGR